VKIEHRTTGSEDPEWVIEVLRDLDGWHRWLPGALEAEVVVHTNAVVVELSFVAPQPLTISVDVTDVPDGIRYRMVEGDLSTLEGEVRVSEHRDGCTVTWSLTVEFPVYVPGPLLAELEREILPDWSRSLLKAARQRTDQSAD
jgi:hypothetical protein